MTSTQIPGKDFLSVADVQEHLRNAFGLDFSIQAIYRWCDEGKLENIKVVGKISIPKKSYLEFIISNYRLHKISS